MSETLTGARRVKWETIYLALRELGFPHDRARDLAWELVNSPGERV